MRRGERWCIGCTGWAKGSTAIFSWVEEGQGKATASEAGTIRVWNETADESGRATVAGAMVEGVGQR